MIINVPININAGLKLNSSSDAPVPINTIKQINKLTYIDKTQILCNEMYILVTPFNIASIMLATMFT